MKRLLPVIAIAVPALLILASCSDLGYYVQCARGQLNLMNRCHPIRDVIADPKTSPDLRKKLQTVLAIREFAVRELALPDNDSYRSYGDLGRPYVVWNVVAAREFSLTPEQWCFPVAGCVAYRGYFSEQDAESFGDKLRKKNLDVYVYGVEAYSTLKWFDDPVLNTFLDRSEPALAGLIFHELAHQVVYAENDSRFNEAFATAVELEGVKRWLSKKGDTEGLSRLQTGLERQRQFLALLTRARHDLHTLYENEADQHLLKQRKTEILAHVLDDYRSLTKQWGGFKGYDKFFDGGLNNAKLASVSTYQDLVPAFQRLLVKAGNDMPRFYQEAARLASLPSDERQITLSGQTRYAGAAPPVLGRTD